MTPRHRPEVLERQDDGGAPTRVDRFIAGNGSRSWQWVEVTGCFPGE
jgi:hypothetical protein